MADDEPSTTGECLCGRITYAVDGPLRPILHCHCENCRRATGNFVAATGCATERLTVHGGEDLRWFDLGYARYGFCRRCGSHLFWVGSEHEELTSIQAGTLNGDVELDLAAVWFADAAQSHQTLDPAVPHHAGNGAEYQSE